MRMLLYLLVGGREFIRMSSLSLSSSVKLFLKFIISLSFVDGT